MNLKIIATLLMVLIVSMPFYTASVFAAEPLREKVVVNGTMDLNELRDKYGVRGVQGIDIDAQCFLKSAKDEEIVKVMNNDIIHIIESIFLVLYLINTVMNVVDTIVRTIGMIMGYMENCPGAFFWPPYYSVCTVNNAWTKGIWDPIDLFGEIMGCLITCPCNSEPGGNTGSKTGTKVICGGFFGFIPQFVGTEGLGRSNYNGKTGGLAQFHINAYDNIYTAIGCLCVGAVLFNLRKLVTIYETYNCCVAQSCAGGFGTEGCEAFLDTASCQYWKGSLLRTAMKIITSILFSVLFDAIYKKVLFYIFPPFVEAGLNIYGAYNNILGLADTFRLAMHTFRGASCDDLGYNIEENLKKFKEGAEPGFTPGETPIEEQLDLSLPTIRDINGDGIYDSVQKNYDMKRLKLAEVESFEVSENSKAQPKYEYTAYTSQGPKKYYTSKKIDPTKSLPPALGVIMWTENERGELTIVEPKQYQAVVTAFKNSERPPAAYPASQLQSSAPPMTANDAEKSGYITVRVNNKNYFGFEHKGDKYVPYTDANGVYALAEVKEGKLVKVSDEKTSNIADGLIYPKSGDGYSANPSPQWQNWAAAQAANDQKLPPVPTELKGYKITAIDMLNMQQNPSGVNIGGIDITYSLVSGYSISTGRGAQYRPYNVNNLPEYATPEQKALAAWLKDKDPDLVKKELENRQEEAGVGRDGVQPGSVPVPLPHVPLVSVDIPSDTAPFEPIQPSQQPSATPRPKIFYTDKNNNQKEFFIEKNQLLQVRFNDDPADYWLARVGVDSHSIEYSTDDGRTWKSESLNLQSSIKIFVFQGNLQPIKVIETGNHQTYLTSENSPISTLPGDNSLSNLQTKKNGLKPWLASFNEDKEGSVTENEASALRTAGLYIGDNDKKSDVVVQLQAMISQIDSKITQRQQEIITNDEIVAAMNGLKGGNNKISDEQSTSFSQRFGVDIPKDTLYEKAYDILNKKRDELTSMIQKGREEVAAAAIKSQGTGRDGTLGGLPAESILDQFKDWKTATTEKKAAAAQAVQNNPDIVAVELESNFKVATNLDNQADSKEKKAAQLEAEMQANLKDKTKAYDASNNKEEIDRLRAEAKTSRENAESIRSQALTAAEAAAVVLDARLSELSSQQQNIASAIDKLDSRSPAVFTRNADSLKALIPKLGVSDALKNKINALTSESTAEDINQAITELKTELEAKNKTLTEDSAKLQSAKEDLAKQLQAEKDRKETIKKQEEAQKRVQKALSKKANLNAWQDVRKDAVYNAAWQSLNLILDEFAYDFIDDMCEEKVEASEPEVTEPQDTAMQPPDINRLGPNSTVNYCRANATVGTAQLIRYRNLKDGSRAASYSASSQPDALFIPEPPFIYQYSYTLVACKEKMAFRVSLKNPFASKEVVAGTLEQGATKQDKTDFFSDPALYDFICIETSDNYFGQGGKRCFDKVTLYETGLSSTVFGG